MKAPARFAALLAALTVVLSVSGCGGDTIIDSQKAEDTIHADLERSHYGKVSSVACPTDQKVVAGATFTCKIDFSDGKHATVTLKIRNEDADVDLVDFNPTK